MFVKLTERFPDYAYLSLSSEDAAVQINPDHISAVRRDTAREAPKESAILLFPSGHQIYVRESVSEVAERFALAKQQERR